MPKQYYAPMHTAEHILNQTMVRLFNCQRAFNCHIERKKSKCDYHFQRPLTEEEVKLIENQVNNIIKQNLPVSEYFLDYDQAAKKFNLKIDKENNQKIRIIQIGDYDHCPCAGNHVEHTGEIGDFKIISSSFENGILRIRFKVKPSEQAKQKYS